MKNKIIEQIINKRKELNISQSNLSDITGINLRTIQRIESYNYNIKLDHINKICEALDLELCVINKDHTYKLELLDLVIEKIKINRKLKEKFKNIPNN